MRIHSGTAPLNSMEHNYYQIGDNGVINLRSITTNLREYQSLFIQPTLERYLNGSGMVPLTYDTRGNLNFEFIHHGNYLIIAIRADDKSPKVSISSHDDLYK